MIVKEDEYTFLVRRKQRQTGDGVRSKDQRVDRGDSDRILENARQTETHLVHCCTKFLCCLDGEIYDTFCKKNI